MSGDHDKYYMKAEVVEYGLKRKIEADLKIGAWLSAALEDPSTCQSMRDDISEWFKCTPQMEAPKREWALLDDVDIIGMTCDCIDPENGEVFSMECALEFARNLEEKIKELNT